MEEEKPHVKTWLNPVTLVPKRRTSETGRRLSYNVTNEVTLQNLGSFFLAEEEFLVGGWGAWYKVIIMAKPTLNWGWGFDNKIGLSCAKLRAQLCSLLTLRRTSRTTRPGSKVFSLERLQKDCGLIKPLYLFYLLSFIKNNSWVKKKFGVKKMFGSKQFLGQKIFGSKKFSGQKIFSGPKNFWVKIFFWVIWNFFGPKKILRQKFFWGKKIFRVKKYFGSKNFSGLKNLYG